MKSDVGTTFCPNFDFTVKALMSFNYLNHRNFQMKTDMNVKIGSCTTLCTQNKILATKNPKSQTTKDFRFRTSYLEKVDLALIRSMYHGIKSNASVSNILIQMSLFSEI